MFELCVRCGFSSAHRLRDYKGKCEELHGHNWKVDVCVCGNRLNKTGLIVDFKDLKKAVNQVLKKLDHTYLNDNAYFKKVNPTSENIAKFIFENVQKKRLGCIVTKVTVWESDSASASFINT
ncbi:6-carboxytetrahydropterin synthase QueD [Candidatus Omnitrophota bacterium]